MPTMSKYAQALCSEIVHPRVKQDHSEQDEHSCHNSTQKGGFMTKIVTTNKNKTIANTRKKRSYKGLKSYLSKTKSSTDISSSDKPRPIKHGGFKTNLIKETTPRSRVVVRNAAVNTKVTGPLTCDKICVTSVRKRNGGSMGCPCGKNRLCRSSTKQIQTPHITEKACELIQCVETVNFGTQLNETLLPLTRQSSSRSHSKHNRHGCRPIRDTTHQSPSLSERLDIMGARRWVVNKYATRGIWGQGPDF